MTLVPVPTIAAAAFVASEVVQPTLTFGSLIIALSVFIVAGFAVKRTKGMEAWKETANAAALRAAETSALADERYAEIDRKVQRIKELEQLLSAAQARTDVTPLQGLMVTHETNAERRASATHELLEQIHETLKRQPAA